MRFEIGNGEFHVDDCFEEEQIGCGTFYTGDCFAVMRGLGTNSVDMVVTSPPYDNLRTYNDGDAWTWESFKRISGEIARVLKKGGAVVWVVADETVNGSETGTSFRQALYFKDVLGLNIHDTMIWSKPTFSAVGALAVRYAPVFEYMFVFSKGKISTFNPIKDRPNKSAGHYRAAPSIRAADGKIVRNKPSTIKEFGQRFNIWDISTVKQVGDHAHPAPFPAQLAHDHILSWSNPGDVVLDPFAGSGTTAVAAENAGRRWICIERDPQYALLARERIEEAIASPLQRKAIRAKRVHRPARDDGQAALFEC